MTTPATGDPHLFSFSYAEYESILRKIKPQLKDYTAALDAGTFTILRHDVEFSVARAYRMAQIETNHGIASTFFFQVLSCAYNPFSVKNRALIQQMAAMGHQIGLHFYVSHIAPGDWDSLATEAALQSDLFRTGLGMDCTCFSYHRPPRWVLENREDQVAGLLCTYGQSFFELSDTPTTIKYIADSKHRWSYGHPLDYFDHQKVQILVHPDEWTESGSDERQYFHDLIVERRGEFMDTIDQETKHFRHYRADIT